MKLVGGGGVMQLVFTVGGPLSNRQHIRLGNVTLADRCRPTVVPPVAASRRPRALPSAVRQRDGCFSTNISGNLSATGHINIYYMIHCVLITLNE